MIENIYFSYTGSEGEAYSYLKYFFRSIGIWTQDEDRQQKNAIQIHILGGQNMEKIDSEKPDCYYLVRKNSRTQSYFKNNRNDFLELKWKNRKLKCFDLCVKLVPQLEDAGILLDLLNIFEVAEAWGAYWIFHEISDSENEVFNQYIVEVCKKIKKSVRNSVLCKNSWNHKYVMLYCDYILCKTQNDVPERRAEKCAALLEKCVELIKEKKILNTSICWLIGKICELSPTERKFSIIYYQKMTERIGYYSSEIYYELAHVYEKIYGNMKEASQYYQKIYKNNRNYYRAEYKLALESESREDWMNAILHYQHIVNTTMSEKSQHISVRSIEYCSKALWGIIKLFSIKDVSKELLEMFQQELGKLQKENMVENRFGKIVYLMFEDGRKELLQTELNKEIHRKINDLCTI